MSTWVLVIIFSWVAPCTYAARDCNDVQHSGIVVPGFKSRQACKDAQDMLRTQGSKSACVPQ